MLRARPVKAGVVAEQRLGELVLAQRHAEVGDDHRGRAVDLFEHPQEARARLVAAHRGRRRVVAGEGEEVVALDLVEPQREGQRGHRRLRGPGAAALLQAGVEVGRDVGARRRPPRGAGRGARRRAPAGGRRPRAAARRGGGAGSRRVRRGPCNKYATRRAAYPGTACPPTSRALLRRGAARAPIEDEPHQGAHAHHTPSPAAPSRSPTTSPSTASATARCSSPAPHVFGPPADRDEAIRVLREAIELGIDHIDTSDFYGPHVTNEIIKEALHPYPEDLTIVTKVGARRDAEGGWPHARSPARAARGGARQPRAPRPRARSTSSTCGWAGSKGPKPGSIAEQFEALVEMQRGGADPPPRRQHGLRRAGRRGAVDRARRLRPEPLQPRPPRATTS